MERNMTKSLPNSEFLFECFDLDEKTGTLFWKLRPESHFDGRKTGYALYGKHKKLDVGRPALNIIKKNGYRSGRLDGEYYYAHRVIWKMINGVDPLIIDHINGNRSDNRPTNLRSVDNALNQRNMAPSTSSPDGVRGVYWHAQSGGWLGQITSKGGRIISFYSRDRGNVVAWRREMEIEHGYIHRGV
jgi:hypothetical protein